MTDDLETVQAALKRMTAAKDKEGDLRAKALTVAMQGVQTALAELLAMGEREDDAPEVQAIREAAGQVAQAIGGLRIEAPTMDFNPTINVASPSVTVEAPNVTVQAPNAPVNNVTVQPAEVTLTMDRGKATIKFSFEHNGTYITGGTATITRE